MTLPVAGPGTALLLDAAGTLLHPAAGVAATYAAHARARGVERSADEVAAQLGPAMQDARALRAKDPDWRRYWAEVVARSTGSHDLALLDGLVDHYRRPDAWILSPGVEDCCASLRRVGMKIAVVSNWGNQLRPLLAELEVSAWFDAILVSGEEGIEKPDPALFHRACARLGVAASRAVHVGDSLRDDVEGARAAGCHALRFGHDVRDFRELRERLLGAA